MAYEFVGSENGAANRGLPPSQPLTWILALTIKFAASISTLTLI
jgi:hypothetical protein